MTYASKTEAPCDCGYLDREARDPDSGIEFDARLNEFNFLCGNRRSRIHHCPFCGGAAPTSLRATLFAHITFTESRRVLGLTNDLRQVEDVLAKFGPPTEDRPLGSIRMSNERGKQPPRVEALRRLVYRDLSPTANLVVEVWRDGQMVFGLEGKYLGPSGASSTDAGERP